MLKDSEILLSLTPLELIRAQVLSSFEMSGRTLRETFCQHHKCAPADFERKVFWRCLYRHAVPLASVLRALDPAFFEEDATMIRQVGFATDLREVDASLKDYHYVNHARRHWLRTGLRIRVSGRRVRHLAEQVFAG